MKIIGKLSFALFLVIPGLLVAQQVPVEQIFRFRYGYMRVFANHKLYGLIN